VAYPLAFRSDEKIIFVPELPYHQDLRYTSRDNRYPVYSGIVLNSEKAAFITTNHPQLDARIRNGLYPNKSLGRKRKLAITWYSITCPAEFS